MLIYLINVSVTWITLFVLFKALLEKEKYFKINRIYLLSSLGLGLVLPLISYIPFSEETVLPAITTQISEVYQSQISEIEDFATPSVSTSKTIVSSYNFNWIFLVQLIYYTGLFLGLARMVRSSSKLYKLLTNSHTIKKSTHSEIVVNENILPFSFMSYIFIGNQDYNSNERTHILCHELYHVQSNHTIDVLLVELLKIIFWWHPMVYLYKRSVAENHEYAADQAVLIQSSRKQYCQLLMKATFPGVNLELTNPFFQTFIKKRITMMYQKESKKINLLKYSTAFIAVVLMAIVFAKPLAAQIDKPTKIASIIGLEKYEKKDNTPIDVSKVLVTQNNEKLVSGTDYSIDATTGKLQILNEEILKNGGPVNVKFGQTETENEQSPQIQKPKQNDMSSSNLNNRGCKKNANDVYYNLEKNIRLPSCPDKEDGLSNARSTLNQFAADNFIWPKEAIEEGYQEFMLFHIAINEEGKLKEVLPNKYMEKGPYPYGIEGERERIIELMREKFIFSPAECDGIPVRTSISFILKLRIPEDKRHLVKIKNASNVVPNQRPAISGAGGGNGIGITYYSNMNVAFSVEVENPDGKIVFTDSRDYMYSHYRQGVQLDEPKNGKYILRVTQDGQVKETSMEVAVFK